MSVSKSLDGNQPILSYTTTSTRDFELPGEIIETLNSYAKYYSQYSSAEISDGDIISAKAFDLFKDPKSLHIEQYNPPEKKTFTLPNGAWAGIDTAAKESDKTDRDVIIAIAKKIAEDEHFNSWRFKTRRKRPSKVLIAEQSPQQESVIAH